MVHFLYKGRVNNIGKYRDLINFVISQLYIYKVQNSTVHLLSH